MNTNQQDNVRSVSALLSGKEIKQANSLSTSEFNQRYKTTDEVMEYAYLLAESPNGTTYTEIFFDFIKRGLRITNPILTKYDKSGVKYAWLVFSNGVGTKVTLDDSIIVFVQDYQNGLIKPEFDFYDLVHEAQLTQTNNI